MREIAAQPWDFMVRLKPRSQFLPMTRHFDPLSALPEHHPKPPKTPSALGDDLARDVEAALGDDFMLKSEPSSDFATSLGASPFAASPWDTGELREHDAKTKDLSEEDLFSDGSGDASTWDTQPILDDDEDEGLAGMFAQNIDDRATVVLGQMPTTASQTNAKPHPKASDALQTTKHLRIAVALLALALTLVTAALWQRW